LYYPQIINLVLVDVISENGKFHLYFEENKWYGSSWKRSIDFRFDFEKSLKVTYLDAD